MTKLKEFKSITALVLVFKKIRSKDKTKYDTFYSNSEAETIINESDIDDVFKSIYTTIISNIQKSLGNDSGWIVDSVIDHNVSISTYNHLAGSSYIKLPKELNHPRKEWLIFKIMNDCKPERITKANKEFAKKLEFPAKVWEIHKIEKKNSSGISVFSYENKEKHPIYVFKKCEEKHVDLLLIGEEGNIFLLKILIRLFMIILYIVLKSIFAFIFYKLLAQKKY